MRRPRERTFKTSFSASSCAISCEPAGLTCIVKEACKNLQAGKKQLEAFNHNFCFSV